LFFCLEYFRCQGNGRFADASNCQQGRYFECVFFGQCKLEENRKNNNEIQQINFLIFNLDDLNLPNGILYSRSCPPGLWFSTLNDRCDYPSAVQC